MSEDRPRTDEEIEAEGAMRYVMGTRDYHSEQADELSRLRAENERLREALKPFAAKPTSTETIITDCVWRSPAAQLMEQAKQIGERDAEIRRARAALEGREE
jgi:hypothetical protein